MRRLRHQAHRHPDPAGGRHQLPRRDTMSHTPILIVDDNEVTRKVCRVAFGAAGFEVHEAADAAAALETLASHRIDIVLQDLGLPGVDGWELARRIRRLPGGSEKQLIAFSALISQRTAALGEDSPFDDFIAKPVPPSELLEIVLAH